MNIQRPAQEIHRRIDRAEFVDQDFTYSKNYTLDEGNGSSPSAFRRSHVKVMAGLHRWSVDTHSAIFEAVLGPLHQVKGVIDFHVRRNEEQEILGRHLL